MIEHEERVDLLLVDAFGLAAELRVGEFRFDGEFVGLSDFARQPGDWGFVEERPEGDGDGSECRVVRLVDMVDEGADVALDDLEGGEGARGNQLALELQALDRFALVESGSVEGVVFGRLLRANRAVVECDVLEAPIEVGTEA